MTDEAKKRGTSDSEATEVSRIFDEIGVAIAGVETEAIATGNVGLVAGARASLRAVSALRDRVLRPNSATTVGSNPVPKGSNGDERDPVATFDAWAKGHKLTEEERTTSATSGVRPEQWARAEARATKDGKVWGNLSAWAQERYFDDATVDRPTDGNTWSCAHGYEMPSLAALCPHCIKAAWERPSDPIPQKGGNTCGTTYCVNPAHLLCPTTEERFWSHVKKGDGCWEWTAALVKVNVEGQKHFYGAFCWRGPDKERVWTVAHRYSYELVHGPIRNSALFVCHRCDNPKCVRPDHLFLGTAKDNNADMLAKGRAAWQRSKASS